MRHSPSDVPDLDSRLLQLALRLRELDPESPLVDLLRKGMLALVMHDDTLDTE